MRESDKSLREEEIRDELTKVLLSNQAPQIEQNEAILVFSEGSSALKALEQTHLFGEGLVVREDQEESKLELLDLDDEQGAEVCKTYLCSIERLLNTLGLTLNSRSYRNEFTNSYKVLYRQMYEQFDSHAAYLPEILDSAQEAFDHLWVNGEKYVFSDHVL